MDMKLRYFLNSCIKMFTSVVLLMVLISYLRIHTKKLSLMTARRHYRSDMHVFSVLAVNLTRTKQSEFYAVNMWLQSDQRTHVKCCYLLGNGSVFSRRYFRVNYRDYMFDNVAQVECPNLKSDGHVTNIVGLTVMPTCPDDTVLYVIPENIIQPKRGFSLALCSKIVYGSININLTIEWMEYNIYMGVQKVVLYTYNISPPVAEVLKYYETKGFLTLIPYRMPFKDAGDHKIGAKTRAAWSDEQVVVYDCQTRLEEYHYVGVIDLDEFIVPVIDRNFEIMLGRLENMYPDMSAVEVYGELYMLDWENTHPSDSMLVTQYRHRTNSSKPIDINQRKLIHIPARVQRASVVTHGVQTINDSYMVIKDPLSVMVINHYRHCVSYRDDCYTRQRVYDDRIVRHISPKLTQTVEEVKRLFQT